MTDNQTGRRKPGPKPKGEATMTGAERQRAYRERVRQRTRPKGVAVDDAVIELLLKARYFAEQAAKWMEDLEEAVREGKANARGLAFQTGRRVRGVEELLNKAIDGIDF
jgi:hypothetical protein